MDGIKYVCLDFDGTIMRYDPTEHFHPLIIRALNELARHDIDWIAHSGRTFEGQWAIIQHSMQDHGLAHMPIAICHNECYIQLRNGHGFRELAEWNDPARDHLHALQHQLRGPFRLAMEDLINRHAPDGVYYREDATVFHVSGHDEERVPFVRDLNDVLSHLPEAAVVQNGEWLAVIDRRLGKGNVLRALTGHLGIARENVLAVGDHGNDLSMLNGDVTPHVACPGDAYPPVQEAVRAAGGYVANKPGPEGTYEAFHYYIPHAISPRE